MTPREIAIVAKELGIALLADGQNQEAEAAAEAAATLLHDDHDVWVTLGAARARQSKHRPAIACFERAIALQPNDVMSHASLGELLLEVGAYTQAAKALETAMALDPEASHPYGRRARALVAKAVNSLKS